MTKSDTIRITSSTQSNIEETGTTVTYRVIEVNDSKYFHTITIHNGTQTSVITPLPTPVIVPANKPAEQSVKRILSDIYLNLRNAGHINISYLVQVISKEKLKAIVRNFIENAYYVYKSEYLPLHSKLIISLNDLSSDDSLVRCTNAEELYG